MKNLIIFAALLGFNASAAVDKYAIDPGHASVVFKAKHLGFSYVYGMFGDVSGVLNIDEKDPSKSSLEVNIKTASLTSLNKKRDEHLMNADFFDAKQYPMITFKSESVKKKGKDKYEITGTLSMHGKSNKENITLTRMGTGNDPWGKVRTGGEAIFKIKRSAYGMNYMLGEDKVADGIELMVSLEGIKE